MNATACLTLAGIYLLVWDKQREDWVYSAFSFTAVAGAALTAFELALLRARDRAIRCALALGAASRVGAVPVTGGFRAALPLRAGRPWLAWSVCGLRTLTLILNFIFIPISATGKSLA